MSQADTQLATEGDDTIDSIAESMGDTPEQEELEQEETEEQEEGSEEVAEQVDDDPEEEWVAGDKTFKVKKSELRAGYMKDADYRQKTAEVAEQRRQAEQLIQQTTQQRTQYATQLEVYLGALHKELIGNQPDRALIESDPQEFLRQQAAYNTRAEQYQQALQHRQALHQQEQVETQRAQAEVLQREHKALLDKQPEWRDETKRASAMGDVAKYLQTEGYTQEEMGGLVDHRALLIAWKAAQFDQLKAAKAKKAAPEIVKPVRPGASVANTQNSAAQRAKERLRRNPNDLDAIVALQAQD